MNQCWVWGKKRLKASERICYWLSRSRPTATCLAGIEVLGHRSLCTCVGFIASHPRICPCTFASGPMPGNSSISLSSCLSSYPSFKCLLIHFPSFLLFTHLFSHHVSFPTFKFRPSSFYLPFFFLFQVHLGTWIFLSFHPYLMEFQLVSGWIWV